MTTACPNWAALVREREHAERSPDVGAAAVDRAWEDALQHRGNCVRCRTVSLQVDPLLLFSGDFTGARDQTDLDREVDELRKRVRLELDGRATERRLNAARTARRRLPLASALAAGAAAAALGLSLLLWPETAPSAGDVFGSESRPAYATSGLGSFPAPPPATEATGLSLPAHVAMAPLVEPLGDEPMRVLQLPGNGLASSFDVVLVVADIAP